MQTPRSVDRSPTSAVMPDDPARVPADPAARTSMRLLYLACGLCIVLFILANAFLVTDNHLIRVGLIRVVEGSGAGWLQVPPDELPKPFRFEDPLSLAHLQSPVPLPPADLDPPSLRAMVLFQSFVTQVARSPEANRCWHPESPEMIADSMAASRCRGFCSDYAILLGTLAQKVGIPARQVVMESGDGLGGSTHVVSELWLEDLGKWVLFDPTYFALLEDDSGAYLSAVEVRARLLGGDGGSSVRVIQPISGSPIPGAALLDFYRTRINDLQYPANSALLTDHDQSLVRRLTSRAENQLSPLGPRPMMIPRFIGRFLRTTTRFRLTDQWNSASYRSTLWHAVYRVFFGLFLLSIGVLAAAWVRRFQARAARVPSGPAGELAWLAGPGGIASGLAPDGPRRPPTRKPSHPVLYSVAAMLIGLIAALLLVEGVVRAFVDTAVQPRYVIDPGYGVRANQPNVSTRHYVPGDYDVAIRTNSAGMRGLREYPVERVPGKRRVLVLGDSFAFGYGVEDNEVVSAVLEDILNGRQPGTVEVLNLAVSGFGQAEELVTWQARGKLYAPDVVVLFYFNNDIGNNAVSELFSLDPDGVVTRTGKAYLPGSQLQEALFRIPPIRWLFEHSQAWNLIRNRLSSLVQRSMLEGKGLAQFDDATPAGVALTRSLLRELVAEIRAAGAKPIIVVIPDGRTMATNFPFTRDEVVALGATFVDAGEFVGKSDYYTIDSHWRPTGHRKTAERLVPLVGEAP